MICPSVCPLNHADMIAARTAALSFTTTLVNGATRPAFARAIQSVKFSLGFLADHRAKRGDHNSGFDQC